MRTEVGRGEAGIGKMRGGMRVRNIRTVRLSHRQPTDLRDGKLNSNHVFMEPSVQVRDLKKDRVNFVLENVDLSYASILNNA